MLKAILPLLMCASAWAQVYEAKNCVYREGDDPRWAQTDYDDSAWKKPARVSRDVTPPGPYLWLRCRVLAEPLDPAAPLFVQDTNSGARQVFVNGIEVGSFGNLATGRFRLNIDQSWPISPQARGQSMLVAVRIVQRRPRTLTSPAIGNGALLELRSIHRRERSFLQNPFDYAMCPINLFLGLVLLVMSWRNTRSDTLFFGIWLLGQGLFIAPGVLTLTQAPLPGDGMILLNTLGNIGSAFSSFFFYSLRGRRLSLFYRACLVCFLLPIAGHSLSLVSSPDFAFPWSTLGDFGLPGFLTMAAAIVLNTSWLAAFLPLRSLRKSDAPFLMLALILFAVEEGSAISQLPWIGEVSVLAALASFESVIVLLVTLCFFILLTVRTRRTEQRQSALQRDMDSAREMQRRLVPERIEEIPGFHINTAYLPAREVGGDFYQFLPADDGSLLVVVGDVSGKGLDAAMVVAVAIGALGCIKARSPREVLSGLNGALTGKTRGGFVTCCCALFRGDGTVEIANAGHIPPYMNGREMELVPGPPLGIVADAEYEAATFSSGADAITFLSDGVLEATSAQGELLGFERLAGLSAGPAGEIAAEAERWGQEDDITVVQVAYE